MKINWYPGHMAKAKRLISENLKLVDMVVELVDARIPLSSTNPDFQKLFQNKIRVVVLNKSDYADPIKLRLWIKHFEDQGITTLPMNALSHPDIKRVKMAIYNLAEIKRAEIRERKGIHKTIRAMVAGIPNVGKSTFINSISGTGKTKTGDRPGVTKGQQMVKVTPYFELLDTPGLLWPRLDDERTGLHLAYTGSIKEEILDLDVIVHSFLDEMAVLYPNLLKQRYQLNDTNLPGHKLIESIAMSRGWLKSGGVPDTTRAAKQILDEYQSGLIGKTILELPDSCLS